MRDKMRKKYQNFFNKKIRTINESIYNDNLWKGRFVVRQISADWERFEDNSGGILYAYVRVYDKESQFYRDFWVESAPWRFGLDWYLNMDMMNNFIIKDIDVWNEEINPYNNKKDWRKIKVADEVWHRPRDIWARSI